jgi:dTDP-4-dehydrorhamnose reductase
MTIGGKMDNNKKLLIFGSGGMVGSSFPMYYEGIDIIRYSHKDLDILDINKVEEVIKQVCPDYILNLAAYTNVEKAEQEISECYLINTYAATKIAELCNKYKIHYVAISTCGIFFNNLYKF